MLQARSDALPTWPTPATHAPAPTDRGLSQVELTIRNAHTRTVRVNWIHGGNVNEVRTLEPGASFKQTVYISHTLQAEDVNRKGETQPPPRKHVLSRAKGRGYTRPSPLGRIHTLSAPRGPALVALQPGSARRRLGRARLVNLLNSRATGYGSKGVWTERRGLCRQASTSARTRACSSSTRSVPARRWSSRAGAPTPPRTVNIG